MSKKISKKTAKKWADKFRKDHPGLVSSVMFAKTDVEDILAQSGCVGLRIYNGYSEGQDGLPSGSTLFLVGTDASGNNLLPVSEDSTTEQYSILDDGAKCPPDCPPNNL